MPVIKIYGIPNNFELTPSAAQREELLTELCDALRLNIANIDELELDPSQITVFFPSDCLQHGLGEEVIVEVTGLFVYQRRTPEVRKRIAELVRRTLVNQFEHALPQMATIEVFVYTFNQKVDSFDRWTRALQKAR